MKIAVFGPNDWDDEKVVFDALSNEKPSGVVFGGSAKGIDAIVRKWCTKHHVKMRVIKENHMKHPGRRAKVTPRLDKYIRMMAESPDICLIFEKTPDKSDFDPVTIAKAAKVPYLVYRKDV